MVSSLKRFVSMAKLSLSLFAVVPLDDLRFLEEFDCMYMLWPYSKSNSTNFMLCYLLAFFFPHFCHSVSGKVFSFLDLDVISHCLC